MEFCEGIFQEIFQVAKWLMGYVNCANKQQFINIILKITRLISNLRTAMI